jgi:hypothetical protein
LIFPDWVVPEDDASPRMVAPAPEPLALATLDKPLLKAAKDAGLDTAV